MSGPASFYVADPNDPLRLVATELTRGPWSVDHQHGGPPSALLADAIDSADDDAAQWRLTRITVELVRPVPIGPVRVALRPLRRGGRAQWWEATLRTDDDDVLAYARAVRLRHAPVSLPPAKDPPAPPLPAVDTLPSLVFPFFESEIGYHTAVEVRIARGDWGRSPTAGWLRPKYPLVQGRAMTGWARVMVAADAANGVAYVLDTGRYAFVNPDLSVVLTREHVGEWVGLDTHATVDPGGGGLVDAQIHDADGPIGRSLQTLVVSARG